MRFVRVFARRARQAFYLSRRLCRLNLDFYRRHYPDLRELDDRALTTHWRTSGWREGRIPSWSELRRAFWRNGLRPQDIDFLAYLALNGDILRSGYETVSQSAVHYLRSGRSERRAHGFTLPQEFVEFLNTNAIEETWPSVAPLAGETPAWDRSAKNAFRSQLEDQLCATSVDDFLIKSYVFFADHTPRGIDLDRFGSLIDYGTPRTIPFAFIAAKQLVRWADSALGKPPAPEEPEPRRVEPATEIGLMGPSVMTTAKWYEKALMAVAAHGDESFVDGVTVATMAGSAGTLNQGTTQRNTGTASGFFDVAVICSVYRPGSYLGSFLRNIEEQSIFDRSEIVILAVQLTDEETALVRAFAHAHANVIVEEFADRIGIYEAWNRGVALSTAPLLTNMNVDDLRRADSLEIQRDTLLRFEWVDVVTQDVQLMLSRDFSWPIISSVNATTRLPPTGLHTLASGLNPPHNGPMWRRTLHDKIGYFREDFRSVSDWDFWMRAAIAGARFIGSSDAHVGYFINPEGLSTAADGVARSEHRALLRDYVRLLAIPDPTGTEIVPDIRATPISRADRYSAGMIPVLTAMRRGDVR